MKIYPELGTTRLLLHEHPEEFVEQTPRPDCLRLEMRLFTQRADDPEIDTESVWRVTSTACGVREGARQACKLQYAEEIETRRGATGIVTLQN